MTFHRVKWFKFLVEFLLLLALFYDHFHVSFDLEYLTHGQNNLVTTSYKQCNGYYTSQELGFGQSHF